MSSLATVDGRLVGTFSRSMLWRGSSDPEWRSSMRRTPLRMTNVSVQRKTFARRSILMDQGCASLRMQPANDSAATHQISNR